MLQVFKSLPVARETVRHDLLPVSAAAYERDTITLGWEDRLRARGRRRSDGGLEFGTTLSRGAVLRAGDAFVLDEIRTVVTVIEREEDVFVISPATTAEWATFAYHIGNSHQPLMIENGDLVCPDVPGMAQLLEYHRIPYEKAQRAFTPIGFPSDDIGAHTHLGGRLR